MYSDSDSGFWWIILIAIGLLYLFFKKYPLYLLINDPKTYEMVFGDSDATSSKRNHSLNRRTSDRREHNLADESIFKIYGYSVGKQAGLTARQRHSILRKMIDEGVVSRDEAISFLEWNIRLRSNNRNFNAAIAKWSADIDYLRKL